MNDSMMLIGVILFVLMIPYVINFFKAIKAVKNQDWRIRTVLRGFGIVFPVLGIFMGLVP
jgi:heme/copper-type cytochrome/quinol oxidase subunit 2